jgi:hypothetical protein
MDTQSLDHATGLNSEQFTKGDIVTKNNGFLDVADSATEKIWGIAHKSVTMAADNQTVAKVEVPYIPLLPGFQFEMDFDADASSGDEGSLFGLTGATGAQQVDYATKSATVGQLQLVKLDPRGEGSVRRGLFEVALPQLGYEVET